MGGRVKGGGRLKKGLPLFKKMVKKEKHHIKDEHLLQKGKFIKCVLSKDLKDVTKVKR